MKTDIEILKDEAIDIIESLLETISWLGGDGYEVECAENMTKEAHAFIEKYKPKPISIEKGRTDSKNGLYCLQGDENIKIEAVNSRNAANKLRVGKAKIKCLIIPGTKLKINQP